MRARRIIDFGCKPTLKFSHSTGVDSGNKCIPLLGILHITVPVIVFNVILCVKISKELILWEFLIIKVFVT